MNIITSSMALTLIAGVTISITSVAAETAAIPERGPIPFAAYDVDGNGAISEQEFQQIRSQRMQSRVAEGRPMRRAGKAPAFSLFDANKDGQLSPEELAAGQQTQMQNRQGRMGQGAGMGRGPCMGKNMPAFSEFDLDSDGAITEKEFYEARSQRIGERVKQGYAMKGLRTAPSFADVDGDSDGKLTPEEFAAGQASHKQRMQQ
ncbi:MAG: EF-hand domain-containing protein [Candidatus Polarisedimenticolaceae bacterium]|nr:EF-hand domain-containing protein [Candidatus Polarisedimenticolaceae bacterium]